MSKKMLIGAAFVTACALSAIGCTKGSDDDPGTQPAAPAPGVGPGPGPVDVPGAAPVPPFHFDDAAAPPSGDAGLDVQPIEQDPGVALGALVWGTDEGGRLVSFRVQATDKVSVRAVIGLAPGEKLLNIAVRPANGMIYALSSRSIIYTVSTLGVATAVGPAFTPALQAQASGFDFNPVADKIRIHTDVDQDLRLDPLTGKVVGVDGTLAFAPTDPNAGQSPNLVGTAYTNSVNPAPTTTMLYAIDSTRNILTRLPNPNDGMIETVGPLGVDADATAGFDIGKNGVALAALHVGTETALYTVDLTTGAATRMAAIAHPIALTSIAVEP